MPKEAKVKTKTKKKGRVKPIPKGYHTATPYLFVKDAAAAIEFYKSAFNAKEIMRLLGPGGRVGHAEIKIGDSPIMLAEENPEMGARGPKSLGGSPLMLHLYVKDVDAMVEQAAKAGAKIVRPVQDQFYGDRAGWTGGSLWPPLARRESQGTRPAKGII